MATHRPYRGRRLDRQRALDPRHDRRRAGAGAERVRLLAARARGRQRRRRSSSTSPSRRRPTSTATERSRSGDIAGLRALLRLSLKVDIAIGVVVTALVVALSGVLADLASAGQLDPTLVQISALSVLVTTADSTAFAALALARRVDLRARALAATSALRLIGVIIAVQLGGVEAVAISYVLGGAAGSLVLARYAWREGWRRWAPELGSEPERRPVGTRELVRFGFHSSLTSSVQSVSGTLVPVILARAAGTAAVGVYRVARLPIIAANAVQTPMRMAMFPEQSRLVAQGRMAEVRRSTKAYTLIALRRRDRGRGRRLPDHALADPVPLFVQLRVGGDAGANHADRRGLQPRAPVAEDASRRAGPSRSPNAPGGGRGHRCCLRCWCSWRIGALRAQRSRPRPVRSQRVSPGSLWPAGSWPTGPNAPIPGIGPARGIPNRRRREPRSGSVTRAMGEGRRCTVFLHIPKTGGVTLRGDAPPQVPGPGNHPPQPARAGAGARGPGRGAAGSARPDRASALRRRPLHAAGVRLHHDAARAGGPRRLDLSARAGSPTALVPRRGGGTRHGPRGLRHGGRGAQRTISRPGFSRAGSRASS